MTIQTATFLQQQIAQLEGQLSQPENGCYVLILNRMTSSNIEKSEAVALFDTEEQGNAFMEDCKVESYKDDRWGKIYKKGSILEWFNEPFSSCGQGVYLAAAHALTLGLPENPGPETPSSSPAHGLW